MVNLKTKVTSIIFIAAIFIAAGFYFSYQKFYFSRAPIEIPRTDLGMGQNIKPISKKPSIEIKTPAPTLSAPTVLSGYKLYKNSEFGFEIQYPVSWMVIEEINENVRGEMVKEYFFKKPNSDLRFAILPRDGLSYGIGAKGTSTSVFIGGSSGIGTQYVLEDGRRLWLLFPQYRVNNWLQDLGRIDAMTSAADPEGDTQIFEQMLSSFKFLNL